MKKVTLLVLMLCFILSGAWCYAIGAAGTKSERDGHPVPIELKESTEVSGSDRSGSINPFINGHVLTVTFSENMGLVSVEIATASGTPLNCLSTATPNGVNFYIPDTGNFIVTITLSNGDVYEGEFTVTD